MALSFNAGSFVGRLVFAAILVFGTYNPTSFSYVSWLVRSGFEFGPVIALVGLILLIGWIVFLRATFMSLGWLGIALAVGVLACVVWLLVDWGLLSLEADGALVWIVLIILSVVLALGMSWSHVRRRLSGQVDTDDLDNGRG